VSISHPPLPDSDPRPAAVVGHICLDVIPPFNPDGTPGLPAPGSLTRVGPPAFSTGGAVSNVGLALHRLGVRVSLVGRIGDDLFGSQVLRLLADRDPALAAAMTTVPGETTSYSVVVQPPGVDRLFLHCPGANDGFTPEDVDWTRIAHAKHLHFGYPPIMRTVYADGGAMLAELFAEARRRDMTTSLDMSAVDPASDAAGVDWPAWLATMLPEVDLFLPSLDEIAVMLDMPPDIEPAAIRAVADRLLQLNTRIVALKLGDAGLYLRTAKAHAFRRGIASDAWHDRELYAPCRTANLVGTTGSGDCTIAGFLAAFLRDATPEAALLAATAVGAFSVEAPDAVSGVPEWSALQDRLARDWPTQPPAPGFADWNTTTHHLRHPV
jgi:sugar/nucleoside kinase (ribokinase family)